MENFLPRDFTGTNYQYVENLYGFNPRDDKVIKNINSL